MAITVITAPEPLPTGVARTDGPLAIFLAGGITGCPDWQASLISCLPMDLTVTLLNPRRTSFDIEDKSATQKQIEWEHRALRAAHGISFWFAAETVQPIVLYELGAWSMTSKPLIVGMDPGYRHRADVRIQTMLVRPDVQVLDGWKAFLERWISWLWDVRLR